MEREEGGKKICGLALDTVSKLELVGVLGMVNANYTK